MDAQFDGQVVAARLPFGKRRLGRVVRVSTPLRSRAAQLFDDRTGGQNVFARFAAVGAGAQNVDPRLISDRRHHGREVHERANDHPAGLPGVDEGPRAVGRGENTRRPPTDAGVYSDGELPRSKPSIRLPPRSPPSTTFARSAAAAASASSTSRNGTTSVAPAASAWQIVDDARSTSITTTVLPASSCVGNSPRQIVDSQFLHVNHRLLVRLKLWRKSRLLG